MPVTALIDSPDFLAMPAAGAGIVIRLALHFWQTECRPLPVADHELRNISRAHAPTWRHWKPTALKVFEQMRPSLERYHQTRTNGESAMRLVSYRAAMRNNAQRRTAALSSAHTPQPLSLSAPRREPQPPVRHAADTQTARILAD